MADLPLQPLYNFGISIISEGEWHLIVRMAPPFLTSL